MEVIRVCGVSLGSARRNYAAAVELAGVRFEIERLGVDGKLAAAEALLCKLDGRVDAIGLGGVNLAYRLGQYHYPIREGQCLAGICRRTLVVDGSSVKDFWEPELIRILVRRNQLQVQDRRVLVTSVLDRYPLASCLQKLGAKVLIGDAMLALKLPLTFASLRTFNLAARLTMPVLSRIPLRFLYPLGRQQEERRPGWEGLFRKIDIIAGDFHLINRHLPRNLQAKTLITSTLTEDDRQELKKRGLEKIVALGITVGQRSFGANILEAMAVGAASKRVFGTAEPIEVLELLLHQYLTQEMEKVCLQGKEFNFAPRN